MTNEALKALNLKLLDEFKNYQGKVEEFITYAIYHTAREVEQNAGK